MALPKLNAPSYEMKIPSTGETVKFRPFLVKAQKMLIPLPSYILMINLS